MGHLATVDAPLPTKATTKGSHKTNTFGDYALTAAQKFSGLLFALRRLGKVLQRRQREVSTGGR